MVEQQLSAEDTVLVTGGTGFTGSVLVRRLCELGCRVRVLARASSSREPLTGLPVEWVSGEVYDTDAVEKAAVGVNYIFHVAAAYREASIADEVYHNVHVVSTQLLVGVACKLPNFKRFVHVSTVGVMGHIENPPADELTRYNPGDVYQETKTVAEKWVIEFSQKNNFPVTIIRPAAIYGPGDRRLLKVFKMAKMPIVPVIGFTKGLYHLIHVEDLVGFMLAAATTEGAIGQIYICGNPHAISIKDIIKVIADRLGRKPRFFRVPATPFFLLGDVCELVCKPFGIEPPIYRRRVAFFTKDRSFNTKKIRDELPYQYVYSNESGLKATADWYVSNKWL